MASSIVTTYGEALPHFRIINYLLVLQNIKKACHVYHVISSVTGQNVSN